LLDTTNNGGAVFLPKFSLDEKLTAIHRYQHGTEGVKSIAKSLGINHEVLRMWIRQYEYHGIKAFEKSYTAYTMSFKLDVLNYMNEHGTSPNEAAVIFKISSPGIIRNWRNQFNENGKDALKTKKKGRSLMTDMKENNTKNQEPAEGSVEALKAELERLRMENAYLKKLNALVQNKEKSPNKTNRN
jgi:transposase